MPNYQGMAAAYAQKYGVPTQLFLTQIKDESGFNPTARSGAGALGIAQFMPATAQSMGVDPMNPNSALDGAARLMARNYKQYGSWERALSAYNSGRPDAYKDPNFANGQTYNYVKNIMGAAGNLKSNPTRPTSPRVAATSFASNGGTAGAQQALAAMMLQQSSLTASGQPDSSSLLAMAMARQQMQAAQQVYGTAPSASSPTTGLPSLAPGTGLVPIDGTKYLANKAIIPQVDDITKRFGVSVNSAYRSPEHNAAVGGAKNSDHLSGNAIDFVGSPQQMKALYTWAQGKFPYVEPWGQAGGNHVHISFIR